MTDIMESFELFMKTVREAVEAAYAQGASVTLQAEGREQDCKHDRFTVNSFRIDVELREEKQAA